MARVVGRRGATDGTVARVVGRPDATDGTSADVWAPAAPDATDGTDATDAEATDFAAAMGSDARARRWAYALWMDIAALGALNLVDHTGTKRRLGDAWASHPTVIVFLRHFG